MFYHLMGNKLTKVMFANKDEYMRAKDEDEDLQDAQQLKGIQYYDQLVMERETLNILLSEAFQDYQKIE